MMEETKTEKGDTKNSAAISEKSYMGFSSAEWIALMADCLGAVCVNLPILILNYNACPAIPNLNHMLLLFILFQVSNGIVKFVGHLKKKEAAGVPPNCVDVLSWLFGLSMIGVSIWGAVLTFPNTRYFSKNEECAASIYIISFLSSAICLGILLIVLLFFLCKFFVKRLLSKEKENVGETERYVGII